MSSKRKVKNAFIWSIAIVYLLVILIFCSISQNSAAELIAQTAANRMAVDRLQLTAYNLLFDFNEYLHKKVGIELYLLAKNGESLNQLNYRLSVEEWVKTTEAWVKGNGIIASIQVQDIQTNRHTPNKKRDLILMSALGIPQEFEFYEGAVDINAAITANLVDTGVKATLFVKFTVKSLHPVRVYSLYTISGSLCKSIASKIRGWTKGTNAESIALNLKKELREFLVSFLRELSQSFFSGKISYQIVVRKIGSLQYTVDLHLTKIELTDISKYAFVLIEKRFIRVSYITNFKITLKYLTLTSSAGPRQMIVKDVVSN
ncbi:MAG: hypothetical protein QXR63_07220 [Candidatus Bathyarchaeia archaeon]|nr:hypothetical protein [Candidatus Bathyarchaeota archaeon]